MKTEIEIGGMHCAACVRRVDAALRNVDGVHDAQVSVGAAIVEFDAPASAATLAAAVERIGFTAKAQA